MHRYFLSLALLLATAVSAIAQTPIPRVGDSCPSGTYRSGDYCKQYSSNSHKEAIPREGENCLSELVQFGAVLCKAWGLISPYPLFDGI